MKLSKITVNILEAIKININYLSALKIHKSQIEFLKIVLIIFAIRLEIFKSRKFYPISTKSLKILLKYIKSLEIS